MRPYFSSTFANASSRHSAGQEAWAGVERAREQIAELIHCDPNEVIFTSSATESNFLAIQGRFDWLLQQGRDPHSVQIAISAIEHPCVKSCTERLSLRGAKVVSVPVTRQGIVDVSFFDRETSFDIVSIMAANHETGVLQPLAEISRILDPKRTFFHCDAAQWAGRTNAGMEEWGVNSISLSAHKLYGPKGIGVLVVQKKYSLIPLFPGSQEGGMRGGTVNVPGAVGFGCAAELQLQEREQEAIRIIDLRERLWKILSESGLRVERTVISDNSLANTLHVRFPGLRGERVVDALDQRGICCSAGPACASGAAETSPVLRAMGYNETQAAEGVRFSLGRETTSEEIERAGEIILDCLRHQAKHVA